VKSFSIYSIFFFLLIFSGCSSKVSETNSVNSNLPANSSLTSSTNNIQTNSATSATTSGQTQVVQNINPNAFNANPASNVRVVPVDPSQDKNKSGVTGRTAPDNSTFSSSMDAKGIPMEVRTFQNNPYLIKVERVFTSPQKTIKIYLKNGKVVEVSEEKLPNFSATAPGTILEAAGVDLNKLAEQNQPKTSDSGKKQ